MPTKEQFPSFVDCFPYEQLPLLRRSQEEWINVADAAYKEPGSACRLLCELPTGSGKTQVGGMFLQRLRNDDTERGFDFNYFYIVPNKAQVLQVYNELSRNSTDNSYAVIYGRGEHPCLYYPDRNFTADEIACSMLKDCGHRVDQETGLTLLDRAEACPYLEQKYQAKQGKIIITTFAFFLFNELFAKNREKGWRPLGGLVIDEVHRLSSTVRSCLSFQITDAYLRRCVNLLRGVDRESADGLEEFLERMCAIVRLKQSDASVLLARHEIEELMRILMGIDGERITRNMQRAVNEGNVNPHEEYATLKQLEVIARNIPRYFVALGYSLARGVQQPLNYTYGYSLPKINTGSPSDVPKYRLVVKTYYVVPLIRKILAQHTLAYSATIGNAEVFAFDSGIGEDVGFSFHTFSSDFPPENALICLPTDTLSLAHKRSTENEVENLFTSVADGCKRLAEAGLRSLVITVSNRERDTLCTRIQERGMDVLSSRDGNAREVAQRFRNGEGDVLTGPQAQFGEGLDLPRDIAPVIWFLRPGWQDPTTPEAQFEMARFKSKRRNIYWALEYWRATIQVLQVRGRNIRSRTDKGTTILVSSQFQKFVPQIVPSYLKPSVRLDRTLEECVNDAIKLTSQVA